MKLGDLVRFKPEEDDIETRGIGTGVIIEEIPVTEIDYPNKIFKIMFSTRRLDVFDYEIELVEEDETG